MYCCEDPSNHFIPSDKADRIVEKYRRYKAPQILEESWLVDALVGYPLADVLASFTLADLKAGMEELELSTKGKKQALIDRLIASL